MRIAHPIVFAAFLAAGASVTLGQPAASAPRRPPQEPFRAAVDLVHVDVSVLDHNGQPVRGLTAEDFIIRENGKLQRVVAFVPVDVPPPTAVTTPGMPATGSDVVTGKLDARRMVVILMDDANTSFTQGEARTARDIARAVIDGLGPADLAAVTFTHLGKAQDFTADRRQLLASVESFTPRNSGEGPRVGGLGSPVTAGKPLGCLLQHGGCAVDTLRNIGTFLQSAPPGRKLVFYVGSGPDLAIAGHPDNQTVSVNEMFRVLQQANVAVNAFDASGLQTFAALASDRSGRDADDRLEQARENQDNLRILAESTGGQAFTDMNAPDALVSQVFHQNASYYLLGFQSADSRADGRFRKLEVSVNRPGLDVRTRKGYYATRTHKPPKEN